MDDLAHLAHLWIQHQQLPCDVVEANEGVQDMSTEVAWNVTYSVASFFRVSDRPALEVAHDPGRLTSWSVDIYRIRS